MWLENKKAREAVFFCFSNDVCQPFKQFFSLLNKCLQVVNSSWLVLQHLPELLLIAIYIQMLFLLS